MGAIDTAEDRVGLHGILEKVYRNMGFDFREYKETTLTRRLERRLRARGARSYADYARLLDQDPSEYDRLINDFTIKVTNFFRDAEAFRALAEAVVPELASKAKNIRVWSAGCATGQEPYSIAMLLLDSLGRTAASGGITILATDIDGPALEKARTGVYAPQEVEGILSAWRERYFSPEATGLRVQPCLRRLVTFQAHNLVSGPPYLDLDLVVCRNVLIYFTPELQRRVLQGFHQGLKAGGFLLLGKSETPLLQTRGMFCRVATSAQLYRKIG